MGDVMDEIRAEAKLRGQEREAREKARKKQQQLSDLDRRPERKVPTGQQVPRTPPPQRDVSRPEEAAEMAAAAGGPQATLVDSTSIEMPQLCGCGAAGPLAQDLFALAGMHPPSEASFCAYFKEWFEQDYFPAMSSKLKRELVARAQSKGFFSGLSSQLKKMAMANTDARLQAEVWSAYFAQHGLPRFQTYGVVLSATVNLGSQAVPCLTTFWGYHATGSGDTWRISPFASTDPDISAVLDELDTRGGMTALLAAA